MTTNGWNDFDVNEAQNKKRDKEEKGKKCTERLFVGEFKISALRTSETLAFMHGESGNKNRNGNQPGDENHCVGYSCCHYGLILHGVENTNILID